MYKRQVLGLFSRVPVASAPPVARIPVLGLFSRATVASAPRYKERAPSFPRGLLAAALLLSAGCVVAPRDTRVHMAPPDVGTWDAVGLEIADKALAFVRSMPIGSKTVANQWQISGKTVANWL